MSTNRWWRPALVLKAMHGMRKPLSFLHFLGPSLSLHPWHLFPSYRGRASLFWPLVPWALSSPIKDRACVPCTGRQTHRCLTTGPPGKSLFSPLDHLPLFLYLPFGLKLAPISPVLRPFLTLCCHHKTTVNVLSLPVMLNKDPTAAPTPLAGKSPRVHLHSKAHFESVRASESAFLMSPRAMPTWRTLQSVHSLLIVHLSLTISSTSLKWFLKITTDLLTLISNGSSPCP